MIPDLMILAIIICYGRNVLLKIKKRHGLDL